MFFRYLLCITLFSKQTLPLLGDILRPILVNNNNLANDPDALSMYAKYEMWNPRVINGWEAKLGDVPYQVALRKLINRSKAMYTTFCGAVIIAPRKLLSAAHCFPEKVTSKCNKICYPGQVSRYMLGEIFAVAGTLHTYSRYNSDGQWRRLKKVMYPKDYDSTTLKNDIAVIVLKHAFTYNDHVGPIPMASGFRDYRGKCLVSGYGDVGDEEDDKQSPVLLLAHSTMIPYKMCDTMAGEPMTAFVCTSAKLTDVGEGDSGGPLVCANTGDPAEGPKGVLVGIISATVVEDNLLNDDYTIFTRISEHKSFINSINSVSMPMYKYNKQSCIAITVGLIYKCFYIYDLFYFMLSL